MFVENDLVVLKNDTIVYKIKKIEEDIATLIGYTHRVGITVKVSELEPADKKLVDSENEVSNSYKLRLKKTRKTKDLKILFGRILHIDGDEGYLESCLSLYKNVGLKATGIYIPESEMPNVIENLITELTPDIVVITGHDTYNGQDVKDLNNYGNSQKFITTVRKIRKHFGYNEVVVIAGACSSHFEALIAAGSNFASSPKRINTHTYDPAVCAILVASTSGGRIVNFDDLIKMIENGRDAIGGIETNGKSRVLF